jgi:lysophospholipase L1-like esterase
MTGDHTRTVPYADTAEAADPYCLRAGEAAALLAGHPWRRFAVLGDSVAEGVGDPVPGYHPLAFADRVAAELETAGPALAYLNLGLRSLRVCEIRARQLGPALDFRPDLALVVCGANDALRPGYQRSYRADAVDAEMAVMIRGLQERGALVVTMSFFVWPGYSSLPTWLAPPPAERMAALNRRTNALAAALDTAHVDLTGHPAAACHGLISADGLHTNARGQAIAAAQTIRRLGAKCGQRLPVPR